MAMSLFNDYALDEPMRGFGNGMGSRELTRFGACDIEERPSAHIFHVDAPGLRDEDIDVSVRDDNTLVIRGERRRQSDEEDEGHHWRRVERSYGSFTRSFRLPDDADVSHIDANYRHGELIVSVPKMDKPYSRSRRINVHGDHRNNQIENH